MGARETLQRYDPVSVSRLRRNLSKRRAVASAERCSTSVAPGKSVASPSPMTSRRIAVWKGPKYLTVVYRIDKGARRLLWVARDRTEDSLSTFFDFLGERRTAAIRFVVSASLTVSTSRKNSARLSTGFVPRRPRTWLERDSSLVFFETGEAEIAIPICAQFAPTC